MVIGNGMLAKAFHEYVDNEQVIIFASGVSNSQETRPQAFQREENLIRKIIFENPQKLFVYLSTCSMFDPLSQDSSYVKHKLQMEKIISKNCNTYLILRISQIFGRSKSPTLLNFLFENITQGKQFDLWGKSNRNIISLNDVINISKELINDGRYNRIFHIANKKYIDVLDLVYLIEKVVHNKAYFSLLNKGEKYQKIPNDIESIVSKLNISFNNNYYLENLHAFNKN